MTRIWNEWVTEKGAAALCCTVGKNQPKKSYDLLFLKKKWNIDFASYWKNGPYTTTKYNKKVLS